ncbi:MAG: pantoate--beta-alanine ligase [Alphaproteobacteria bacterium]|nr:pantoate--beta-alanine ligase [Alphaproteobacteria bacterium]
MSFDTVRTVDALRASIAPWHEAGQAVGLVPTMGALHDGHLALVGASRISCVRTVVTIFVNPAQFGPSEDLVRYPRREAEDAEILRSLGVDLLYAPPVSEVYRPGFATRITVGSLADRLEGAHRPDHFTGVATVVAKLLLQARPQRAFFGEKDFQQLQVVRRMAADLDIPVDVVGVETVREPDGLALSSRNEFLSPAERAVAPALNRTLCAVANAVSDGVDCQAEAARGAEALIASGFDKIDYLAVVDAQSFEPIGKIARRPARALAAGFLGKTRLIDNVAIPPAA